MSDYNLSLFVCDLIEKTENSQIGSTEKLLDKEDELMKHCATIQEFLNIINKLRVKKDNTGNPIKTSAKNIVEEVNCNGNPDHIALVDKIRSIDTSLLEANTYSWSGKDEIDGMVDNLSNFLKLRQAESHSMQLRIEQKFYKMHQSIDTFGKIEETDRRGKDHIIKNK